MSLFKWSGTVGLVAGFLCGTASAAGATISECQELLRTGKYVECLDQTAAAIARRSYGEEWPVLKASAEEALGRIPQAMDTIDAGLARYSWSIRLRMMARRFYRMTGDHENAGKMLSEIDRMATAAPWRYTDADDLVALGQAAIDLGADPRDVLEGFFDRARRNYKSRPDGHVAYAQLALDKGDPALAAEVLSACVDEFAEVPDVLFLLAEAIGPSEPERAAELIAAVLKINPDYGPALIGMAERRIDGEDYLAAEEMLNRVLDVNPWHSKAHALHAVIHHLRNNPGAEARSRSAAMAFAAGSPEVDFVIGQRLSRKYRFAEAAAYQRQALSIDPDYIPSQVQLAQDLLRLGHEEDGWQLAESAHEKDGYSTTLFNLLQLRDSVDRFATLTNERFVVRMHRTEADVYGERALSLLVEAWQHLSAKYGYEPSQPVIVEIFDRPDDFAVRTFGIPDVGGFLGVCFGNLITANSPVSQRENPTNWESVLWHEFCHVITLQMTGNRIPRWLSEGISVYEERLKDARWGQSMSPAFRQRVLSGNITPVSQLSNAFLHAESGDDLNFAYYESSMVVEFLVETHGHDAVVAILRDLNSGLLINDALERQAGGLETIDSNFEDYLTKVANEFAPGVTFTIPGKGDEPFEELATPANLPQQFAENPGNYTLGLASAALLLRAEEYEKAQELLSQLILLYPEDSSPRSARRLLSRVYAQLNRADDQAQVLTDHLQRSGSDFEAAETLLNLHTRSQQWSDALKVGHLVIAIDPMQPSVLRNLVTAAESSGDSQMAIRCLRGLLHLEPADAPRFHFQLARLLVATDAAAAKRHVLMALELAPRYREAHRLLLQLESQSDPMGL